MHLNLLLIRVVNWVRSPGSLCLQLLGHLAQPCSSVILQNKLVIIQGTLVGHPKSVMLKDLKSDECYL